MWYIEILPQQLAGEESRLLVLWSRPDVYLPVWVVSRTCRRETVAT